MTEWNDKAVGKKKKAGIKTTQGHGRTLKKKKKGKKKAGIKITQADGRTLKKFFF